MTATAPSSNPSDPSVSSVAGPGPHLSRRGAVWTLDLGSDENRLNLDYLARMADLLDRVGTSPPPAALVTHGTGKFFSSGLDLAWIGASPDRREGVLKALQGVLAQLLSIPVPTIAAVQGHAVAGGAMVAAAHDATVMRSDRGYWYLPEVELGLAFTTGMTALLSARLPARAAHAAMTTARRYTGPGALAAGIVDSVVEGAEATTEAAVRVAQELARNAGPALGTVRSRLHAQVLHALLSDDLARPQEM